MRALVTGITGQDGAYLAQSLHQKGHEIFGGLRKTSSDNIWRLDSLEVTDKIKFFPYEIGSTHSLVSVIDDNDIDFVFHLAGNSFTIDSINFPEMTIRTNTLGCIEILEAIKNSKSRPGVFIANSSEIFGNTVLPKGELCHESTQLKPKNPYGYSHAFNLQIAEYFRHTYSLDIWVGILFNHESPLRTPRFLTRKLSKGFAGMLNGNTKPIRIGNFNPFRDFGFAPTFVSAILDMVENCPAENFILSGGAYHSVREVISIFAVEAGFCPSFVGDGLEEKCIDSSSGEVLVNISPEFYRDVESIGQKGNSYKLENLLKRSIHYPFQKIASEMLKYDLSL